MDLIKLLLFCSLLQFSITCTAQFDREEYTHLAIDAYNRGELSEAASFFGCIIEHFPEDSTAYFDRGFIYDEACDYPSAIADFTTQISIDASSVDSYYLRGMIYEKLGLSDAALTDYRQVVKLEFDNSDAHLYIGLLEKQRGRKHRAMKALKHACETNPTNTVALAHYGWTAYHMHHKRKGISLIEKALKISEENTSLASYYKGFVLIDEKKNAEALTCFSKALESFVFTLPEIPIQDFSSEFYPKWKKFTDELMCMSSLSFERDTLIQSKLLMLTGHPESAERLLKKNCCDSTNYDHTYLLAVCMADQNRYSDALLLVRTLISYNPYVASFHFLEARCLKALGEHDQACEAYQKYLINTPATHKIVTWKDCLHFVK